MGEWRTRLHEVYAAVFIDAIYVERHWSGRAGASGNRPFYAAIGVDLQGRRDVLGLWAGTTSGESAKFRMSILTEPEEPRHQGHLRPGV